jgi:hypothetical protein
MSAVIMGEDRVRISSLSSTENKIRTPEEEDVCGGKRSNGRMYSFFLLQKYERRKRSFSMCYLNRFKHRHRRPAE